MCIFFPAEGFSVSDILRENPGGWRKEEREKEMVHDAENR